MDSRTQSITHIWRKLRPGAVVTHPNFVVLRTAIFMFDIAELILGRLPVGSVCLSVVTVGNLLCRLRHWRRCTMLSNRECEWLCGLLRDQTRSPRWNFGGHWLRSWRSEVLSKNGFWLSSSSLIYSSEKTFHYWKRRTKETWKMDLQKWFLPCHYPESCSRRWSC